MPLSSTLLLAQTAHAAAEPAAQRSILAWMIEALGVYSLILPGVGLALMIGALLVVALSRRPAMIGAYTILLPLPVMLGLVGSLQGFINSYHIMATAGSAPRPADMAAGISTGLYCVLVGLLVTFPAYAIVALGLLVRTASHDPNDRPANK